MPAEGYRLEGRSSTESASGRARLPGLSNGLQTLRQLLPAAIESGQPLADLLEVVAVEIADYPRFAYRSAMLDVARHFFTVAEVERYIDEIAMLKINTPAYAPRLTTRAGASRSRDGRYSREVGGLYEVGGGPGGFYTQDEFAGIIDYAAEAERDDRAGGQHAGPHARRPHGVFRAHLRRRRPAAAHARRSAAGAPCARPAPTPSGWP